VIVTDLDKILSEVVTVGTRLGALNRDLEQQVDGMRDSSLKLLGEGAQRSLDTQLMAAREAGTFEALDKVVVQSLAALAESGQQPSVSGDVLRDQLERLRQSFAAVSGALKDVAPPVVVSEALSAEYQAFAQSLREMAQLEGSMQKVAESGQQVIHRLANGRKDR
jgi:hypothetical protein